MRSAKDLTSRGVRGHAPLENFKTNSPKHSLIHRLDLS